MTNEVIIRCQKTPEVGIRRIPAYIPPIHPWNQSKMGGLGKIWGGPVPPGPSLKPPLVLPIPVNIILSSSRHFICRLSVHTLSNSVVRTTQDPVNRHVKDGAAAPIYSPQNLTKITAL